MNHNLAFRQIRLFISSTFQDMNKERDYLTDHIFPRLIEYCERRNIYLMPIDLRWGITEEDGRNGRVIEACLEEVDNSRPFFVGLIGQRYGWIPTEDEFSLRSNILLERHPWLQSAIDEQLSITEIEMRYAALKRAEDVKAIFFLRSDTTDVPKEFREEPGSTRHNKLTRLKNSIRKQNKYPVYDYSNISEMGEYLYEELVKIIDMEYPMGDDPIREHHEFMLEKRANVTTPMESIENDLIRWIESKEQMLIIRGYEGSGISTALCWLLKWARYNIQSIPISYFDLNIPTDGGSSIDQMKDFFSPVIESGQDKVIIAIDNAYLLETNEIDEFCKWMNELPGNIHIIICIRENTFLNRALEFMHSCPSITIHGLPNDMRNSLIDGYLARFGKNVTLQQRQKLAAAKFAGKPRTLKAIIDLLINFGYFEQIDQKIEQYANDYDLPHMDIVYKLMADYKTVMSSNVIATVVTAMSLGHRGLTEQEIMDASGCSAQQWSMIRGRILSLCNARGKCYMFYSHDWAQAVKNILNIPYRVQVIKRMISYFLNECSEIKRQADILYDLHNEWLALADGDDFQRAKDGILSLRLCVPLVVNMSKARLTTLLWKCNLYQVKPTDTTELASLGKLSLDSPDKYYEKVSTRYYTLMRDAYLALGKGHEALYYNGFLNTSSEERILSEADIRLEMGEAKYVLSLLSSYRFLDADSYARSQILTCRALCALGKVRKAGRLANKLMDKVRNDQGLESKVSDIYIELNLSIYEVCLDNPDRHILKSFPGFRDNIWRYQKGKGLANRNTCQMLYVLYKYYMATEQYKQANMAALNGQVSASLLYGNGVMWCKMLQCLGRTQIKLGSKDQGASNILEADRYIAMLQKDDKSTIDALYDLSGITWSSEIFVNCSLGLDHLNRIEAYMKDNNYPRAVLKDIKNKKELKRKK